MLKRIVSAGAVLLALGLVMSCGEEDGDVGTPVETSVFGSWQGKAMGAFPVLLVLTADSVYTIQATMGDTANTVIYYEDGGFSVNSTKDTLTLYPDTCGSPLTTCDTLPRKAGLNLSAGTVAYALVVDNTPYSVTLSKQ